MKLTAKMRRLIIENILQDIPTVDYGEKARVLIQNEAFSNLPDLFKQHLKEKPDDNVLLSKKYYHISNFSMAISNVNYKISEKIEQEVKQLRIDKDKFDSEMRKLRTDLESRFRQFTTVKQLANNFPEFEKYLPVESKGIKYLPATNVIRDLKNLGWKSSK